MTDFDEMIKNRRAAKGTREVMRKCHCGKIKAHHTNREARACSNEKTVDTVVSQMTSKEISESHPMKI